MSDPKTEATLERLRSRILYTKFEEFVSNIPEWLNEPINQYTSAQTILLLLEEWVKENLQKENLRPEDATSVALCALCSAIQILSARGFEAGQIIDFLEVDDQLIKEVTQATKEGTEDDE